MVTRRDSRLRVPGSRSRSSCRAGRERSTRRSGERPDRRRIRSLRHRTGARRVRRCGHVGAIGAMEPTPTTAITTDGPIDPISGTELIGVTTTDCRNEHFGNAEARRPNSSSRLSYEAFCIGVVNSARAVEEGTTLPILLPSCLLKKLRLAVGQSQMSTGESRMRVGVNRQAIAGDALGQLVSGALPGCSTAPPRSLLTGGPRERPAQGGCSAAVAVPGPSAQMFGSVFCR
jgi:hypothetical protein